MNRLISTIVLVVFTSLVFNARAYDGEEPVELDWYPLFTDSVGWNIYSGGFMFGWVNGCGSDLDFDMGHGYELAWLNVVGAKYNSGHGQRITMGLGIDWRNYKLKSDRQFVDNGGILVTEPYPEGATRQSSRVKVFSLTLPILFRQRLFNKVDLFAGPVVNFNLHASVESVYTLDGEKMKYTSNDVGQVPVTVDILGGVKWNCLGAYVRYSPCHVLKESRAPAFTSLSAGLWLGF